MSSVCSVYQVVIPREIRERFDLRPGQKLMFIPYNNTLRLVVVPPVEKARGILKGMNTEGLREEENEPR